MTNFVMTVVGADAPGLVSSLSAAVEAAGGNWLDAELSRLGGTFAGVVMVDIDPAKVETLKNLDADVVGLRVDVQPAFDEGPADGTLMNLFVMGHDRPGIVHEVTEALAHLGVTIDAISTGTRPAPMGDGVLFEADADVRIPDDVSDDDLRAAVEELSDDLVVDLSDPAEDESEDDDEDDEE